MEVYSLNTVIVGSGAAGLNAADRLYNFGQKDIAVITEGLKMGTSRNTGSDKQTYYKLSLSSKNKDSTYEMAETLFSGGAVDGDIALVESALSTFSFYHLVDIGVPFPHNQFGEYIGYKTDHAPKKRATSAGPLTSYYMTEKLEKEVQNKSIKIFDNYQVIAILTDKSQKKAIGLLTLNKNQLNNKEKLYTIFNTTNIIYATGGPAGMYAASVYPSSQTGASGLAFEVGVKGKNLTEWQYGIASTKFRWNLSGSYQQVLPTYISTDQKGNDRKEFLNDYFSNPKKMFISIFKKGYEWPFDPRKVKNQGSSLIDIIVYYETIIKGRRVWLDYRQNSKLISDCGKLNISLLGKEVKKYLKNSEALFGNPIERLKKMNKPAIDLYANNGINLKNEMLEIAVCAQHNNGGLAANIWWESNLKHFFPVGEVNGSHGVYRPGGSALNAGQVGSTRAAQFIANCYRENPLDLKHFKRMITMQVKRKIDLGDTFLDSINKNNYKFSSSVIEIRKKIGQRMSKAAAHIRSKNSIQSALEKTKFDFENLTKTCFLNSIRDLSLAFQNYDLLFTQLVYLKAIKNYIDLGGKSRGSYLIKTEKENIFTNNLIENLDFDLEKNFLSEKIQLIQYKNNKFNINWRHVRPIPDNDYWFEKIWNKYRKNKIIK
nr:FAD-binding protein [Halanaerobium praevalens]